MSQQASRRTAASLLPRFACSQFAIRHSHIRYSPFAIHPFAHSPGPNMKVLLIYDIPDDRARNKVADLCLDYGLERVQYSAFQGELRRTHQEELVLKMKKRLGKKQGDIRLLPICDKDWSARLEIINGE
jgi:CRISPR-associated protein Cas2